ncbi:inter alpha-trypsin inhibitor, heavy chain 4-like isoform X2 [Mangifera indica]|uniref:inter alpha-trypsin inhibitor, heavy chain 4-like isoform X2 n=1 Tax=Mangifera indica TaxID=29780 RepID=UPI001CFB9E6F|nr:inter alpha-trypsin inhibitor, heavy chain 4-like isoform X2 [Mangifera indica]
MCTAGFDTVAYAWSECGSRLLLGFGLCYRQRNLARALCYDQQEMRLQDRYSTSRAGVEVDIAGRLFHNKLITQEDAQFQDIVAKSKPGGLFLKGRIYTFKIPQVNGGSTLSIKVNWSQKLTYEEGQLCLSVPFTFPGYVFPVGKKISKREKIQLNVNSGLNAVIQCKCTSHPLKEVSHEAGKSSFLYEAQVPAWSSSDLKFSYTVSSDDLFGGVLLQSPSLHDFDQRQMFCLSLFPGKSQTRKVFTKEVVFLVDISGSMQGDLLKNVKSALLVFLANLSSEDSFNIIAFNGQIRIFSSSMELASKGAIQNATQWLNDNLIADGGTDILLPLKQALKLLSDTSESIPLIFLITDGTVDNERAICNEVKSYLASTRAISPRICTFGIGLYCNHYFLQMLAQIGRGHYDCAYHPDFVEYRIQRLFTAASSVILADVTLDTSKHADSLELLPFHVPDLSSGNLLILSGRYTGKFPDSVKVSGKTADMSNFSLDLKVQNAKDIQLDRLLARRQIDMLTAHAWLLESKELEDKVAKISIQTGFPSEFTSMLLLKSGKEPEPVLVQEILNKIDLLKKVDSSSQSTIFLGSLGVGFGNLKATAENTPPGFEESKSSEAADLLINVASSCCNRLIDHCCCMCFIQTCSSMNKQCSIVFSQICAALACFECISCCFEVCECF